MSLAICSGDGWIDPELLFAHQGLAGELQQDTAVGGRHIRQIISMARPAAQLDPVEGSPSTPEPRAVRGRSANHHGNRRFAKLVRTNRAMAMFSPSFAIAAWTIWPIVILGSRIDGWSSRQTCS